MISFFKYHGAGNDFILIDERALENPLDEELVKEMCHRRFGIGADGVLVLRPDKQYDFSLTLYNADGKEGSLCGNGSRCAVHAAYRMGFVDRKCRFLACDGVHDAEIHEDGTISISLQVRSEIKTIDSYFYCNNGTPHLITYVNDLDKADVIGIGRKLRNDRSIREGGVNVNFVLEEAKDTLRVRTYERGVEDETLACGTGAVAVALVHAWKKELSGRQEMIIRMPGGNLQVSFDIAKEGGFKGIRLRGPAKSPFQGKWNPV